MKRFLEGDIYFSPTTAPNKQEENSQIYRIKEKFRECGPQGNNAVHSRRQSYKTTALIDFVAERLLILSTKKTVLVVCPHRQIAEMFERQYVERHPNVRRPRVCTGDEIEHGKLNRLASEIAETYVEEVFLMPRFIMAQLQQGYKLVFGVGTLEEAMALKINW